MTGNQIRKSFLDFFIKQGHTVVRSSSLVPDKDPTLLFTNAGMVQFKNVFLGQQRLSYTRAASAQKCLRISGKHNDLEVVGRDTYHHTFFEMLGNWSFGDYYKAEAIEWAWQLLTKEWGLPKDKLYATVYLDDDEAEKLWHKISGLPPERVSRFGEKENFWEMGETGPCGPCSEIHLDRGPAACDKQSAPGHECRVNGDCARYIELWNLVFIQYNRKENRELEELPSKHVDTGMGLERITAVLQNVLSNYDIDYMRALTATTEQLTGKKYGVDPTADISFRVIDDHARAVSFLIADGVMPSNEGRGYVLRRLLRRAARHGRLIGLEKPFLHQVAKAVAAVMGDDYPELRAEAQRIGEIIRTEEERFGETLEKGLALLEEVTTKLKGEKHQVLPGDVAFRLYDTFGFPLDLTEDILRGESMSVDQAGFEKLMQEQRTRGREARETASMGSKIHLDRPVCFIGYDRLDGESSVLAIYGNGAGRNEAVEGDEIELLTAETPFYGESGGQIGDRGTITTSRGDIIEVIDTHHPTPQLTAHRSRVKKGRVQVGDQVQLAVDPKHRQKTRLNHSATHILHSVLRRELGPHVRQAGSLVTPERLRFDFNHSGAIADEQLGLIETKVNQHIREDAGVSTQEVSYDEAIRHGALAFFGDKYGDRVRVVKIGDFSTELCGGTHVRASGEIGIFKLHSEGGVAAGVRRVEAFTGQGALDLIHNYEQRLKEIGNLVRGSADDAVDKVKKLLDRQKDLEREIEKLRGQFGNDQISSLLNEAQSVDGARVVIQKVEGVQGKQLGAMADQLKERLGNNSFVFLASPTANNVTLVGSTSASLTARYNAGDIIRQVAPIVGGGGGGRPDFAQAGGKDPSKIDEAIERVWSIIRNPTIL
ncbi:MAG: alanine--tRNA ligase [Candidatus Binatia bacterium]